MYLHNSLEFILRWEFHIITALIKIWLLICSINSNCHKTSGRVCTQQKHFPLRLLVISPNISSSVFLHPLCSPLRGCGTEGKCNTASEKCSTGDLSEWQHTGTGAFAWRYINGSSSLSAVSFSLFNSAKFNCKVYLKDTSSLEKVTCLDWFCLPQRISRKKNFVFHPAGFYSKQPVSLVAPVQARQQWRTVVLRVLEDNC